MRAIDVLNRDHDRIKTLLVRLETAWRHLEAGHAVDAAPLIDLVTLCEHWVDRAHVLKEEQALFPLLKQRGLGPEITVVSALMAQHQTGQAFLRELRAAVDRLVAGDPSARREVRLWLRDYVDLVREHMRIEDHYFYDLAGDQLTAEDDAVLLAQFERIDRAVGGASADRHRWNDIPAEPRHRASR
jgi:hemerythrin-like domain-containing protein